MKKNRYLFSEIKEYQHHDILNVPKAKPKRGSFKSLISAASKSIDKMFDHQEMAKSKTLRKKKLIWKFKVEMIKSDCDWDGNIIYSLTQREMDQVVE